MVQIDQHPDWHITVDHLSVQVVTHRHGDVEATAYLYSNARRGVG